METDDQYFNWTRRLEADARRYRATVTLLGIARYRRQGQRDVFGIIAKALWRTRDCPEWEIPIFKKAQ